MGGGANGAVVTGLTTFGGTLVTARREAALRHQLCPRSRPLLPGFGHGSGVLTARPTQAQANDATDLRPHLCALQTVPEVQGRFRPPS